MGKSESEETEGKSTCFHMKWKVCVVGGLESDIKVMERGMERASGSERKKEEDTMNGRQKE